MSRRFSNEPINLIQRIPSPKQLSAARPTKPPFGHTVLETGAAFVRSAIEFFAPPLRSEPTATVQAESATAAEDVSAEQSDYDDWSDAEATIENVQEQQTEVMAPFVRSVTPPPQSAEPAGAHLEEVAELRAYILSQQQDIARLAEQVQELKSLIASQQHVFVSLIASQQHVFVSLGKELETGSRSRMGSIALALAKRNRPVRQTPAMKSSEIDEKAVVQDTNSIAPSLYQ
jgi:hypothetical protein